MSTPDDGVDLLVAHHVRLPKIVGADDDAIALQLFAAIGQNVYCLCHSFNVLAYLRRALSLAPLLSTLMRASFRIVRITW